MFLNETLSLIQTADNFMQFRRISDPQLLTFSDASLANVANGSIDVRGCLTLLADSIPFRRTDQFEEFHANIAYSQSTKIKKPTHGSAFSAEAVSLLENLAEVTQVFAECYRFLTNSSKSLSHRVFVDNEPLLRSVYRVSQCDEVVSVANIRRMIASSVTASNADTVKLTRCGAIIGYHSLGIEFVQGTRNPADELTKLIKSNSMIDQICKTNSIRLYFEDSLVSTTIRKSGL